MTTATAPSPICFTALAQGLALIVGNLQRAVAAWGGRDRAKVPSVVPTVVAAWGRLGRLVTRFEALVARLRAGRTVAPRSPAERPRRSPAPRGAAGAAEAASGAASDKPRPDTPQLPSRFGWLVWMLPEAAGHRSQLIALLAEPEMAALLAADPKAGRILRPLCRILAIKPEGALALPPARRKRAPETAGREAPKPRTPRPRTPKPRTPRFASGAPPPEPPSAVAQVWAALIAHTSAGITPAATPDPRPRKPPWIMGR